MEKLVEVHENEVRIDFEIGCKCRTTIHLKSLMHTMHVAFKVQTSSPDKFLVKPSNGFIPPLGDFSFEIILKPRNDLLEEYPRSKDRFLIKTALAPDFRKDGNNLPDKVPTDWFVSREKQVFVDGKLKVVSIGGHLLRHLVAKGDIDSVKQILKMQNCCNHADEFITKPSTMPPCHNVLLQAQGGYITQCPIQPGGKFTYTLTIIGQEGTLWWHAHVSWLRATVHGAMVIYPKKGSSYPLTQPHAEIPIGYWKVVS